MYLFHLHDKFSNFLTKVILIFANILNLNAIKVTNLVLLICILQRDIRN